MTSTRSAASSVRARSGWPVAVIVLLATACSASDAREGASPGGSTDAGTPSADTPSPSTPGPGSTPTPTPTPAGPPLLLPDLSSLPAEDVHIEVAADGTRLLRFAGVLVNSGPGPLVVVPAGATACPPEQHFASQVVYVDADTDGVHDPATDVEQSVTPAGCMIDHPTHGHWHFDASARYVLTAPGSTAPIVAADKVSFCLRDSRPLSVDPIAPETYGECERDSIQGISPGWGDVYRSDLDGQALPLPPDLADGRYCLTLSADPLGLLREVDDDDNAATVSVRVTGATASVVAPGGCAAA